VQVARFVQHPHQPRAPVPKPVRMSFACTAAATHPPQRQDNQAIAGDGLYCSSGGSTFGRFSLDKGGVEGHQTAHALLIELERPLSAFRTKPPPTHRVALREHKGMTEFSKQTWWNAGMQVGGGVLGGWGGRGG
jgi:hypothetical protein